MKNFVETSFMFDPKLGIEEPLRAKILTVTKRQLLIHKDKFLNILTADFEPETRKAELEMLIADNRPDLEGCRVFSFVYDFPTLQWQIGVIHESFPVSQNGCELESEPFIKELPSHIEMKNGFGLQFFKTGEIALTVTQPKQPEVPADGQSWRDKPPLL